MGVDPIMVSDGPHGLRKQSGAGDNLGLSASEKAVCFPSASASACTFDVDLMKAMGEALADEARDQGVSVLLGPGVNMKRSPLCGRNFEYFSEDPFLSGELGAAYIQGVQGRGVGTSLKHFVCNNQEKNRLIVDSVVDDRALFELYLESFRIAVKRAQPWTIMTAYNLLNGTYCSENEWLMKEVARDEWGFEGAFVTDWGAQNSNTNTLPAGLDLVMPGPRPDYRSDVAAAVSSGAISMSQLDDAVCRVFELHEKHRSFAGMPLRMDAAERLDMARKVAEESSVLLKNDGVLPLSPDAQVAVIGSFAREPRYQGAGSSKINPISLDCTFDALVEAGVQVVYESGYDVETGAASEEQLAAAERIAVEADVALVFVGLPDSSEAEGADRPDMTLPHGHDELVMRVCAANPNTVVVLQGGSPMELPWRNEPRAILLSYLAGCRGGHATANLLLGHANPSGKLAETWPLHLADTPCANFYPSDERQVRYRESIYTGYRYYDAAGIKVAYPFGFGLSYTSFFYGDLQIVQEGEGFSVTCSVFNEGACAGKEAVQLYIAPLEPSVFKAPQQLKGFTKVYLQPGERKRVSFTLEHRDFSHFDAQARAWVVEEGSYEIRVSASSRDVRLRKTVEVSGCAKRSDDAPLVYHDVKPGCFSEEAFAQLYGRPFPKKIVALRPYTANATIGDLKSSFLGNIVHYLMKRELKLLIAKDPAKRKLTELMLSETPLRMLAMSGMDMNLVAGVVDILNYRFIRGFKRLRSFRASGEVGLESPPLRDEALDGA